MTEPDKPTSLDQLDSRLRQAQARRDAEKDDGRGKDGKTVVGSGMGFGLRIATDILAAMIVGVGVGLLLDGWLGTAPWLLILFFFLGAAAGMLNVYRTATSQGYAVGYVKSSGTKEADSAAPEKDKDLS